MPLDQFVTFISLLKNDAISLDAPVVMGEDMSLLDMTSDENVPTEDDLIDIIDRTKKMKLLVEALKGLTAKELRIIAMRFGFGPLV